MVIKKCMEMQAYLIERLQVAINAKASDIHFIKETEKPIRLELRTFYGIQSLPATRDDEHLFHYLMYLSDMDVSKAYLPQSGSFEIKLNNKYLSCRFAVIQSHHKQSGVLRILNQNYTLSIAQLSNEGIVQEWMHKMIQKNSGFVLFSGLTGSGKTTTMYSLLRQMENKKIFSLEDPIEVYQDNMVQLQVSDQQLSYEEGIKQLLRHDPDVILIGEIRDSIAAKMALRCALTGHLVFSSIHSSKAELAISRMEELGVSRKRLKDVLLGISCQELREINGHKQAVYEVMDEKELMYYFQYQKHSANFIPLDKKYSKEEIYFI